MNSQASITLVAFSDLHMWRFGWDGDLCPKCLLGLANLALRRARHYPIAAQTAMIERLADEQADHVLFAGDITTTSLRAEFEQGQMLLAPLMLRYEGRFHAIPGNHDRYTPRAAKQRLYERLFLGRDQSYPFTVRIGEGWSLVAIDCSVPRWLTSRGQITDENMGRIGEALARERSAGRQVMVMGHYPLVYPKHVFPSWEHILPGRDRLRALLQSHGVKLYLHGHKHLRWLTATGPMIHANCGSAGFDCHARRPGYIRIRLDGPEIASFEAISMSRSWNPAHPATADSWITEELAMTPARES